jgi:hypothetical protein
MEVGNRGGGPVGHPQCVQAKTRILNIKCTPQGHCVHPCGNYKTRNEQATEPQTRLRTRSHVVFGGAEARACRDCPVCSDQSSIVPIGPEGESPQPVRGRGMRTKVCTRPLLSCCRQSGSELTASRNNNELKSTRRKSLRVPSRRQADYVMCLCRQPPTPQGMAGFPQKPPRQMLSSPGNARTSRLIDLKLRRRLPGVGHSEQL